MPDWGQYDTGGAGTGDRLPPRRYHNSRDLPVGVIPHPTPTGLFLRQPRR